MQTPKKTPEHMKLLNVCVATSVAVSVVGLSTLLLQAKDEPPSASQAVVDSALLSVGLSGQAFTVGESKGTPGAKEIPFITADDSVVRIRINDFVLQLKDGQSMRTNPFIRSLDLFYSKDRKQLIKVVSVWPEGVPGTRFPTVDVEEENMKHTTQTFTGIPTNAPRITLMEALESALGACSAKQLIAYYVLESYAEPKTAPRPVWIIHCWGIPPFPPVGGPPEAVPVDLRNHLRSTVDAETGKWYGTDTIPQPR